MSNPVEVKCLNCLKIQFLTNFIKGITNNCKCKKINRSKKGPTWSQPYWGTNCKCP